VIDLLVAGGGPAGLATACFAAQRGWEAVVVEPRPGVVDKACGEGLMPGAVRALAELGVRPPGLPFEGIRYVAGGRSAAGRFARGPGLGVRRTALHAALRERAAALGVRTVEGRVAGVRQGDGWIAAAGLRARWLAAADGLRSPLRRRLGLGLPPRLPRRYGLRRHFAVRPWSRAVEVHLASDAEAYVTPVAPDLVGVAILFGGRAAWPELLGRFPGLAARLAAPATPVRGAGPFEQRVRRRVAGRVLLVGDAAGYVDPLTGEGVRLGLESARLAVDHLARGRPAGYERAWRRLTLPYRALTTGLLLARRFAPTRAALVPLLARCPALFDLGLAVLDGSAAGGRSKASVAVEPAPTPLPPSPAAAVAAVGSPARRSP